MSNKNSVPNNIIQFPKKNERFKTVRSKVTGQPVCIFPEPTRYSVSRKLIDFSTYSNDYQIDNHFKDVLNLTDLQTEENANKDD
jgi:hypothetical protein